MSCCQSVCNVACVPIYPIKQVLFCWLRCNLLGFLRSSWSIYPSKIEIKKYSAPDNALMGKRPVRSEWAACDNGMILVSAVRCEWVDFIEQMLESP